jgi:phage shock protein B
MEVFGILFLVVVAPIWIVFHYISRMKESKGLSTEDARLLEDLWEKASAMESRINTLETILDAEAPGWRKKV